jgi:hypothetical protein
MENGDFLMLNEKGERESVSVLRECIELQEQKGSDYQAKESSVKQADYYPGGVVTIHDIMHAKSLIEKEQAGGVVTFESLEDSAKDLINYASFFVAYCRGKVDGQTPERDKYNKLVVSASSLIAAAVKMLDQGILVKPFDNVSFERTNQPVSSERGFTPK